MGARRAWVLAWVGHALGKIPPEYLTSGAATSAFPSEETAGTLRLYGVTHGLFHDARFWSPCAGRARAGAQQPGFRRRLERRF
jgi:hypothetical protein